VLGLVFKRVWKSSAARAPHGGQSSIFQTRYPINFVVKHRNPLLSPKWASPEAVETCRANPRTGTACFEIGVTKDGDDLEAANAFWWS
jgi:hypothetical protein